MFIVLLACVVIYNFVLIALVKVYMDILHPHVCGIISVSIIILLKDANLVCFFVCLLYN